MALGRLDCRTRVRREEEMGASQAGVLVDKGRVGEWLGCLPVIRTRPRASRGPRVDEEPVIVFDRLESIRYVRTPR